MIRHASQHFELDSLSNVSYRSLPPYMTQWFHSHLQHFVVLPAVLIEEGRSENGLFKNWTLMRCWRSVDIVVAYGFQCRDVGDGGDGDSYTAHSAAIVYV